MRAPGPVSRQNSAAAPRMWQGVAPAGTIQRGPGISRLALERPTVMRARAACDRSPQSASTRLMCSPGARVVGVDSAGRARAAPPLRPREAGEDLVVRRLREVVGRAGADGLDGGGDAPPVNTTMLVVGSAAASLRRRGRTRLAAGGPTALPGAPTTGQPEAPGIGGSRTSKPRLERHGRAARGDVVVFDDQRLRSTAEMSGMGSWPGGGPRLDQGDRAAAGHRFDGGRPHLFVSVRR